MVVMIRAGDQTTDLWIIQAIRVIESDSESMLKNLQKMGSSIEIESFESEEIQCHRQPKFRINIS